MKMADKKHFHFFFLSQMYVNGLVGELSKWSEKCNRQYVTHVSQHILKSDIIYICAILFAFFLMHFVLD